MHTYCSLSTAPTISCFTTTSSAITHYQSYLKAVYKNSPITPDNKWPPTPSREYIKLALIHDQKRHCRDEYIGDILQGNIEQVLGNRKEISMEQILVADEGHNVPRLILMEGAPGIGKSTLALELCRKWDKFSCMKKYSLVVLLRLREKAVQRITSTSELFYSYESEDKKSLLEEVLKCQGKGILFILDGFDELPRALQQDGVLLSLIKGTVLHESTVLVTSRHSATAEFLNNCCPQKQIEILGFTQESVEAYASRVFSSEPEKLEKFKTYISASKNPAINSLMYVPLNAAIIVQIYLYCWKSDSILPHTLTELYTQLCLTILHRYLKSEHPSVKVVKFEELPGDLYKQFLALSRLAFEGLKEERVVFHALPPDFVHFDFLDSVSALYGGGGVSYNFLHLTLQEFFTAYHISQLSSHGLEVFKQYGKDEKWNVVWRFVAGLTKFEHYENHINDALIGTKHYNISPFFIQCLFEAQTMKHFNQSIKILPTLIARIYTCTSLDAYALGYCIANIPTGISWKMYMYSSDCFQMFASGLETNAFSPDIIRGHSVDAIEYRSYPIHTLRVYLTPTDMFRFSELIPHMTCLETLNLHIDEHSIKHGCDFLARILQQLSHTNCKVTRLILKLNSVIGSISALFQESPNNYLALKDLINPSFGKLEELYIS